MGVFLAVGDADGLVLGPDEGLSDGADISFLLSLFFFFFFAFLLCVLAFFLLLPFLCSILPILLPLSSTDTVTLHLRKSASTMCGEC